MHTFLSNIFILYQNLFFKMPNHDFIFCNENVTARVFKSFKNPKLTPMYRIVPKSLMMLKVPSAAFKVYLEGLAKKKILPHFCQDIIVQS